MKERIIIIIALVTLTCWSLSAQLEPVRWSFDARQISETEYELTMTADIARSWSIYSQHLEKDKGPVPTSFEFFNIELLGDTKESGIKKEAYDQIFEMNLVKFSRKALFKQRVRIPAGASHIKGQVTYMTCNEESCLPPTDLDFEINVK